MSPEFPEPVPASPAILTMKVGMKVGDSRVRSSNPSRRGRTVVRFKRFEDARFEAARPETSQRRKNRDQRMLFMTKNSHITRPPWRHVANVPPGADLFYDDCNSDSCRASEENCVVSSQSKKSNNIPGSITEALPEPKIPAGSLYTASSGCSKKSLVKIIGSGVNMDVMKVTLAKPPVTGAVSVRSLTEKVTTPSLTGKPLGLVTRAVTVSNWSGPR